MGRRTNRAGERVPSTSKRQIVFLTGRSASAGKLAITASVILRYLFEDGVKKKRQLDERSSEVEVS